MQPNENPTALDSDSRDRSVRRGSVLEGRVRALLEAKGYTASTNRIILDHEIDVWGKDGDGRIAVAECKEYYDSGPVTVGHVRNFFGKIYDIQHNYGENIYLALFVSVSGFTESARSLCERLGILALDLDTLELFEKSDEELLPRHSPLEDQAVIALRRQRDQLREEINRRQLVRQLSQRIEEYRHILETRTIPSFLVPSAASTAFWYTTAVEIPFLGLPGEFEDFVVPAFPLVQYLTYHRRRFLGRKRVTIPCSLLTMDAGVIHVDYERAQTDVGGSIEGQPPLLRQLMGCPVVAVDGAPLGTTVDFLISFRDGWSISAVKVLSAEALRSQLKEPRFMLPSERISLKEAENAWTLMAHVKLASQIAAGALQAKD